MQRAAVIGLAMTILAAACALVGPNPPPNTTPFKVEVRNNTQQPIDLVVASTSTGAPVGLADPAAIPPLASANVTIWVPRGDGWTILANGSRVVPPGDLAAFLGPGCNAHIAVEPDGYASGCE
jgi:hypothetical protein